MKFSSDEIEKILSAQKSIKELHEKRDHLYDQLLLDLDISDKQTISDYLFDFCFNETDPDLINEYLERIKNKHGSSVN